MAIPQGHRNNETRHQTPQARTHIVTPFRLAPVSFHDSRAGGGKHKRLIEGRAPWVRNLVAALLHHEQIQTTVPKAKEAARVAEKVSLG